VKLSGTLPVIPTPFHNGRIDYDSLLKLFDHLFPHVDGYTLSGSTGEAVSLAPEERKELMTFAAQNSPTGKTVVVGLTHTNLQEMIHLGRHAKILGIAAGLVPCPYYFPNSFAMVLEFFRALDRNLNLNWVFYDNPVYTKTWLRAEELLTLVDACEHLKAVKMTDHDLAKITSLKQNRVSVFCGDDVIAFASLLRGVDGSMIIAPSVFPAAYQQTVHLLAEGNLPGALRLFSHRILPFIHLLGPGDEISCTKALFKHLGIFRSDELRPPLLPCSPERVHEIVMAYELCQEGAD
jgi:4-hydroxy-tetrahydrodipicolinate synthase